MQSKRHHKIWVTAFLYKIKINKYDINILFECKTLNLYSYLSFVNNLPLNE
jgi:hypothetical protein